MRSEARRVFRRLMQLRELEGGRGAGGWWRGTLRGPPMTTERLAEPLPADVRAIGARTRDVECLLRQLDRLLVARQIVPGRGLTLGRAGERRAHVGRDRAVGHEHRAVLILHLGRLLGEVRHALAVRRPRSEEHTSELQSLLPISYALFCLQKKTTRNSNYL